MDYKEFKTTIRRNIKEWNCSIIVNVQKKNGFLDEVILHDKFYYPIQTGIYINDLYTRWIDGETVGQILEWLKKECKRKLKGDAITSLFFDRQAERLGKITFKLVNQNEFDFSEVPHREFLNMVIVYQYLFLVGTDFYIPSIITNKKAKELGMSEEQLYDLAYENTKKVLEPNIRSMQESPTIGEFTTRSEWFGSVGLLYPDLLDAAATLMDDDIYICAYEKDHISCIGKTLSDFIGNSVNQFYHPFVRYLPGIIRSKNPERIRRERISVGRKDNAFGKSKIAIDFSYNFVSFLMQH